MYEFSSPENCSSGRNCRQNIEFKYSYSWYVYDKTPVLVLEN